MIKDENIDPGASIGIEKLGFPYIISGKHTDGTLPQVIWVAKGGADAAGATGVSHVGTRKDPFLTVGGTNGALRYTVDGRGDRIILGPGIWRENLDFGSGTGTTGAAGRMNKRDIGIFGSGGSHPGRVQIVGNGTTTGPTIRVRDGYLRGFILSNLEVGAVTAADADRAVPILELETSDTAALTANSSDEWAVLKNVRLDGGATATTGLLLTGATMVRTYDLEVAGCLVGVMVRGSLNNDVADVMFHNTTFRNNVTADVAATSNHPIGTWPATWTFSATGGQDIQFHDVKHTDRGGTPVTNYINWGGGTGAGTVINCGSYKAMFARDVADGTLLQLPVDYIVQGWDATDGFIAIIGA